MLKVLEVMRQLRAARDEIATKELAETAGMRGDTLEALLSIEHERQREWDNGMAWRLSMDAWAELLMTSADRRAHREKAAARERRYLGQHIAAMRRRVRLDGQLASMAVDGERLVFWALGTNENHCRGCLRMGDRLWPIDLVARVGPTVCHHGCQCRLLTPAEAIEEGYRMRRGRVTSDQVTAGTTMGIMEALRIDGVEDEAISRVGRALPPAVRDRVRRRLRESLVVEDLREARIRVRSYLRDDGTRVRSHYRGVEATVPSLAWPKGAQRSAKAFHDAVATKDPVATDQAIAELSKELTKNSDDTTRRDVLRNAQQIRSAMINPHGMPIAPGSKVRTPLGRANVPLMVHDQGRTDPWSRDGNFPWRLDPEWFGSPAAAEKVASALAATGFVERTTDPQGRPVLTPKTTGAALRSSRRKIARALELNEPRLRNLRYDGRDAVPDATPLDVGDDEPLASELSRAELRGDKGIRKTAYPNVTGRQLGDAAETILDGVASRMSDLGIAEEGAVAEHPAGERGDANSPVDWVIGNRAIEVKAISLRSASLAPHAPGPSLTIGSRDRTAKVAYAKKHGLQPSMIAVVTDLDSGRGFSFLMDYDPDDEVDWFKSKRIPAEAVSSLLSGEAQPGDEFRSRQGVGSPVIYLGQDRLGFNPMLASEVEVGGLRTEQVAAARARVAKRAATEVTKVERAPRLAPEGVHVGGKRGQGKRGPSNLDVDELKSMVRSGLLQREIVERTGMSQSAVSRAIVSLKASGELPEVDRKAKVQRLAAEGHDIGEIARRARMAIPYVRDLLGEPAPSPTGVKPRFRS